jgi:hypothetical protein
VSSSLNEEMVQLDSHLTAVRAFQRPCYSRSVGMQPFTFCPCRQGHLPRSRWLGFTSTDWLEIFIAEVLCYCYFNPVTFP